MNNHSNPVRLGSLALTVLIAMSGQVSAQDTNYVTECDSCEVIEAVGIVSEIFEGSVEEGGLAIYPSQAPQMEPELYVDLPVFASESVEVAVQEGGLEVYPSLALEIEPAIYDDGGEIVMASVEGPVFAMPSVLNQSERDDTQFVATPIEGNLCLNKQTYVSFLCAWQGFERP